MRFYFKSKNKEFSKSICDKREFNIKSTNASHLKKHQIWLANFINPTTPYKSIFIYHGLGSGKTCTAISIAEKFRNEVRYTGKKIYIVSSDAVKQEFRNNFYSETSSFKCAGSFYEDTLIKKNIKIDSDSIMKELENYYSFHTYDSFTKIVADLEKVEDIKKGFDDSIVIIDEAQNVRMTENKKQYKRISLFIEKITDIADMRMIFMSATPIFDKTQEFVWFVNIMNKLDLDYDERKQHKPLKNSEIFKDNNFKSKLSRDEFTKALKGKITYVKSGNPAFFPLKLYDESAIIPKKKFYYGNDENTNAQQISIQKQKQQIPILENDPFPNIDNVKLTLTLLSENHAKKIHDDFLGAEKKQESFSSESIRINNLNLPENNLLTKRMKNKKSNNSNQLPDDFAPKCNTIYNKISKSKGVSFVYSRFVEAGVNPMIYVLEKNGYKKYCKNNDNGQNLYNEFSNVPDPEDEKRQNKRYIVITGSTIEGSKIDASEEEKNIARSIENKDGDRISVIIASEKGAEGIDLKFVRSIHIHEADFNMSKIEQVIGRGVRTNSHKDLDKENRNVTVYYHCTDFPVVVNDGKEELYHNYETIDMKLYRRALKKYEASVEVQEILKENSVTCALFQDLNTFDKEDFIKYYGECVIDAEGNKRKTKDHLPENDIKKIECAETCASKTSVDEYDYKTFHPFTHEHFTILRTISEIQNIYKEYDVKLTFENIRDMIHSNYPSIEDKLIQFSLSEMILNRLEFTNCYDLNGFLKYEKNYYVFIYIDARGNETHFVENLVAYSSNYVELTEENIVSNQRLVGEIENTRITKIFDELREKSKDFISGESLWKSILLQSTYNEDAIKTHLNSQSVNNQSESYGKDIIEFMDSLKKDIKDIIKVSNENYWIFNKCKQNDTYILSKGKTKKPHKIDDFETYVKRVYTDTKGGELIKNIDNIEKIQIKNPDDEISKPNVKKFLRVALIIDTCEKKEDAWPVIFPFQKKAS